MLNIKKLVIILSRRSITKVLIRWINIQLLFHLGLFPKKKEGAGQTK